ncbi:hypothetical protein CC79DRAFT_1335435 [Sarocladium strictum]
MQYPDFHRFRPFPRGPPCSWTRPLDAMPLHRVNNSQGSTTGDGDQGTDRNDTFTSQEESSSKRRRVAIACSACRIRKSRCNGDRPRCGLCERLGFECVYEMPETAANLIVRKDLFAALEERVKTLEHNFNQQEIRLAATESERQHGGPATVLAGHSSSTNRPDLIMTPNTAISINLQDTQEQHDESGTTDGMALALVDENECGFFGPSSNISFMQHIFAALAKKSRAHRSLAAPLKDTISLHDQGIVNATKPFSPLSVADPSARLAVEIDANVLPPDYETEALLQAYFSNTGLLFPYVHEQTFMETYRDLKAQKFSKSVRRTWLGLLNMILALATSTASQDTVSSSSRRVSSEIFYRRAQKLCRNQMLRGTTLETVQYLLITSQYLQGTQNSLQTWTTHGLAVKAAFSIGLHFNDILKVYTPLEQEIRKRTWYGCILLDRTLGMTFGRPFSIPQEYVRVDLPTPIGDLQPDMSVAFYNATIRLYAILANIIGSLYGYNLGSEKEATDTLIVTHILQISQDLSLWQMSLPSHLSLVQPSALQTMTESPEDPINERYRIILTLRHLNTQLLLHRLILTRSLDHARSEASDQARASIGQMERNYNMICIRSAEDIITIVHCVLTKKCLGRHLVGAWWFTLYYTFNAALAIFGGLLAPLSEETGAGVSGLDRLRKGQKLLHSAIDALLHLDEGNVIVERCSHYLRYLLRLIDCWTSSSHSRSNSPSNATEAQVTIADERALRVFPVGVAIPAASDVVNMEDLELGPFFTSEMHQWFEDPPWESSAPP